MPHRQHDCDDRERQAAKRALCQAILWRAGAILVLAVAMFLSAGQLGWMRGWVLLVTYLVLGTAALLYLWRANPDVIVARSTLHRGGKRWDRLPTSLLIVAFMATLSVAAIDDARFHWSAVPFWLTCIGYVLLLIGMAANVWALSVNKFAEPAVRIQTERRHMVVDTGPYAIVRHPLYATSLFLCGGIPLALGSFWALIPASVTAVIVVVRTALEDRTLYDELDGYKEYASRVRYRLAPGVW
jgi:protein-S-isoprenylcysteine O-methyltransferase Ste14